VAATNQLNMRKPTTAPSCNAPRVIYETPFDVSILLVKRLRVRRVT
jgi:hypothetical protein